MKVLTTTPFLSGAPGEAVTCRVRIENDSNLPSVYRLRVVGFDERNVRLPAPESALPAGGVAEVDVELFIPEAIAPGNHAVGVEVRSDRTPEAGSVAAVTVSVGSLDRVLLTVNPSTVRGHKAAKFWIDVLNRDREAVELELGGDATDGAVRVKPRVVRVEPNQRVRARGRVTGPIRFFGEPRQLPFTVSAQGRTAPIYTRATYQQRPLFPRPLRGFLAVLLALSLWAGALGAGLWWWTNRDDESDQAAAAVELVDVDGDGIAETPADQLVDTDSDGVPDTPAAEAAAAAAAAAGEESAADDEAKEELPTFTLINGTVKAGETGQNDGVLVTLTPITLGAEPTPAAVAFRGAERATGTKLWPARYGVSAASGLTQVRQTETLTDLSEGADGAFVIPDVLIRQTYEINFAKVGFDSQSFVVTPTADGEPVEMEIVLEPSEGALGGLVTGGGGALGNVAIDATDGTLLFATTTASEGAGIGRFSLPAVNTPATYTITATLRGYGTEVIQVPLSPGEQQTELSIAMRPGVGSIIGRVTSAGAPLGGTTLTVSNGDDTRTTTSLTDGDVGLYNFPQLEIPGTYTVTASAPGYVTQTRLVDLAGNVTGVDFDLIKTTATITGVVASNVSGPLPGAAIDISRDNLSFSASSAAAPQPGAFNVDDLPPGTYLVRFSRFDHAESSQLVTLSAGQVFDLGTITLTFTGSPELPSTGSINVDVVDSQNNPLNDATVRVLDISTRDVIAEIDGSADQSSFIFQNVPVGTYTIQVERRLYRVGETRVSVGLGPQSVTVPLFLLGQVSGRLVDSLTNQQLTDYEVTISRVNADGSLTFIERVPVAPNQQPDPLTGRIEWESSPNSLTTGTYRIEVTDPPPGYAVANDQVIDPNRPTAPVMEFEITPTQEDPIQVNDIEADKYPQLTGRILKPLLTTPATNGVDFAPVDDDTLAVTLTCPGAVPITAALTDAITATPGLDSYTITPIQLETAGALGNCQLSASATGFVTSTVTLDPPLAPSDGVVNPDQVVNVAIVAPAETIGGSVVWIDTGTPLPTPRTIDGVEVATEGSVIVGFDRAQGSDPDADPTPILAIAPLRSFSAAGSWTLDGQVFGQSTYAFSDATRFETGRITLTIDETPPRVVAAANAQTVATDNGAGGIAVELTPLPGSLSGQVGVVSVNPVRFTDATVAATGPAAAVATPAVNATNGSYAINPAAAGTWGTTVTMNGDLPITDPRDYTLAVGASATASTLVNPGAAQVGPTTTFVEHPRIEVRVLASNGQPIDVGGTRPTVTVQPNSLVVPPTSQTVGADGSTFFRRLQYNAAAPLSSVNYRFSVTMPGFDLTRSTATVVANGSSAFLYNGTASSGTLNLAAGAKPIITIRLPRFGTLNGNVVGQIGSINENILVGTPGVTIQGRRVGEGILNPNGVTFDWVARNEVYPAIVDPTDPDGFRIAGPPGAYTIEIVHPDFEGPFQVPPGAGPCTIDITICFNGQVPSFISLGRSVYVMTNDVDTNLFGNFVMSIRRIEVRVSVTTASVGGSPVSGATVRLVRPDYDDALISSINGTAVFTGVIPGTNQFTAVRNQSFPVIASLDIGRFSATGDGIVDLTVVMPPLGQQITGVIGAVNSEGDPIHLPPTVDVTRSFTVPDLELDGAAVDNTATEAGLVPVPAPSVTVNAVDPPGTPQPFQFDAIASGVHELTFTGATGYTSPSPNPRTVTVAPGIPFDVGQVNYRANDIQVVVNVTSVGEPLTTATVRLVSPDGAADTLVPTAAGGTYTFGAVPPEIAGYTLNITDPLHSPDSRTVSVIPSAGPTITIDVAMNANVGRVSGVVQRNPSAAPGDTVPLSNEGSVQLTTTAGVPVGSPVTPGVDGSYTLITTTAGNYRVVASLAGYTTESVAVNNVRLGRTSDAATITLLRLASATIEVTGLEATDPSLAVTVVSPASAPGVTVTRTGLSFSITGLDPDVTNYRFQVSANAHYTQLFPSAPTFLDPAIGGSTTYNAAMVERSVSVVVSTNPANVSDAQSATVELRIPANGTALPAPTRTGSTYRFGQIAPSGAGEITIIRTGYRTKRVTVDPSTAPVVDLPVTIYQLVTVTGTVSPNGAGATVTATSGTAPNQVVRTATADATGNYTLTGLDLGTWTFSAEKLGVGTGTAGNLVIGNADTFISAARNFTLTPRSVQVTVQVESPATTALTGATVQVNGVTAAAAATPGSYTATVTEAATLNWTISHPQKIARSGSATLTAIPQTIGPIVLSDRPTLGGVVSLAGTGVAGATVRLCLATASPCNGGAAIATVTTAAGPTPAIGTYAFTGVFPAAGTYQIRATTGTEAGTVTNIVVAADGSVSPAGPYDITLA